MVMNPKVVNYGSIVCKAVSRPEIYGLEMLQRRSQGEARKNGTKDYPIAS